VERLEHDGQSECFRNLAHMQRFELHLVHSVEKHTRFKWEWLSEILLMNDCSSSAVEDI
jgi:hypothetical protein